MLCVTFAGQEKGMFGTCGSVCEPIDVQLQQDLIWGSVIKGPDMGVGDQGARYGGQLSVGNIWGYRWLSRNEGARDRGQIRGSIIEGPRIGVNYQGGQIIKRCN